MLDFQRGAVGAVPPKKNSNKNLSTGVLLSGYVKIAIENGHL
jgi:hypothetical protein